MTGAILGDIIGSVYERRSIKSKDFEIMNPAARFTDDTVLTIAIADAIMKGISYLDSLKYWGLKYRYAGFGSDFSKWLKRTGDAYSNMSFGNGAAMRVTPIGYAFDGLDQVLEQAKLSAMVSHHHPEAIKGAQAIAGCVFLAKSGNSKVEIRQFVMERLGYNLNRTIDEIRPDYKFDSSCQGSVPEAIIAFLEGTDYEDCIRNAISLGGDSDTIACMTGGIAEAYYGTINSDLIDYAEGKLPDEMKQVIRDFNSCFVTGKINKRQV